MLKAFLTILLACTCLLSFLAGDHVVELCTPDGECAESTVLPSQDSKPASADTHGVPHDCSCPAHHSHCSHNPLHAARTSTNLDFAQVESSDIAREIPFSYSTPDLDGPFQPPKA